MKHLFYLSLLLCASVFLFSCDNDDDGITDSPDGIDELQYADGLLISNEGPFASGFGTVTFASQDFQTVTQDIYQSENNGNLGSIVQSIGFADTRAFIIANVSNRITVVNRFSFEEIDVIENGLNNPRYFVAIGDTGYVTNWGDPSDPDDDFVALVDLTSYTVTSTIAIPEGPEQMIYNGTTLYIALKGGFSVNDKVVALDPTSGSTTSIEVGEVPNSMILDTRGNLWILCGGIPAFTGNETAGSLVRLNTQNNTVEETRNFAISEHPSYLNFDGIQLIYYLDGAVYAINASSTLATPELLFEAPGLYNMNLIDGKLYGCDAGDFSSNGSVEVYDLNTGTLEAEIPAGVIPGNVYLNSL